MLATATTSPPLGPQALRRSLREGYPGLTFVLPIRSGKAAAFTDREGTEDSRSSPLVRRGRYTGRERMASDATATALAVLN